MIDHASQMDASNGDRGESVGVGAVDGFQPDQLGQSDSLIARLILDHHQAVYRYAFRMTGQTADAEDLTQQTYLLAHKSIHQLRDVAKARAWLFSILRSCFLKSKRKTVPLPAANLDLDVNHIPADASDQQIDSEQIQQAIDQLPAEFKLALLMFYFEDCSYREIAEKLDIPIGTVMSRLSRAKGYLRGKLLASDFRVV